MRPKEAISETVARLTTENRFLKVKLAEFLVIERYAFDRVQQAKIRIGYMCNGCKMQWSNGQAPRHLASCIIASNGNS